jgi:hypothetical protein
MQYRYYIFAKNTMMNGVNIISYHKLPKKREGKEVLISKYH